MNTSKVWYVTGASQGLGLTLVKNLLANGYRIAATSRNAQALKTAVGIIDSNHFLPLAVDLNNPDCIDESVRQAVAAFGRIDVLVNNAGYGMTWIVEDTTEEHISTGTSQQTEPRLVTLNALRKYLLNLRKARKFRNTCFWGVTLITARRKNYGPCQLNWINGKKFPLMPISNKTINLKNHEKIQLSLSSHLPRCVAQTYPGSSSGITQ
ncbi:MAG TPA: SDR family NAD(P)-dependent oxidoreductase [Pseudosphingobacterium sp.]|nr:SDR family NAD(P)-dependent oxidoreductase [Pseudosphingobacterium sp.]